MFVRASCGPILVALAATGFFACIPAVADTDTDLLGSCAQRNDPLECVPVKTAATAAEVAYLNNLHGVVTTNEADLLATGRRTCNMFVYAGQTTDQATADIGRTLKLPKPASTAVMNSAMMFLCPGLTIGVDGVPRPM